VSLIVDQASRERARRSLIAFSGTTVAYLLAFGLLLTWAWLRQPLR
jgi:hypothetical protein